MLRQITLFSAAIALTLATVPPAIARPMTQAETAYLGKLSRLPAYQSVLESGASKKAIIDMGWSWCKKDQNQSFVYLTAYFQEADRNPVGLEQDNLAVNIIGSAVAVKHLCPERRSTYGSALNMLSGSYAAESLQMLWAIAK
jgi:hypothetical protein